MNIDASLARQERDWHDTKKLLDFIEDRDPFSSGPELRNIATGVIADAKVNSDAAKIAC